MPSLKDILILIFVLFGCLVITLFSYKQPVSENLQQAKTSKAILSETSYQVKALIWGETKDLKEKSDKQPQDDEKNQQIFENYEFTQGNRQPAEESGGKTRSPDFSQDDINPETTLSLETILAEVKNLSSDLWLEFQTIHQEDCPSCSQSEDSQFSICATILASPGVGACNCATLGCTPPVGPWCIHPCCCVCCPPCCF